MIRGPRTFKDKRLHVLVCSLTSTKTHHRKSNHQFQNNPDCISENITRELSRLEGKSKVIGIIEFFSTPQKKAASQRRSIFFLFFIMLSNVECPLEIKG